MEKKLKDSKNIIKVLIVNDSVTEVELMKRIIATDSQMEIVGIAHNGFEALALVHTQNPSVVLMDVHMPQMDGIEATRQIMSTNPCPILIVTFTIKTSLASVYDCLRYGAFEVIKTPSLVNEQEASGANFAVFKRSGEHLLERIRVLAKLKDIALVRASKNNIIPEEKIISQQIKLEKNFLAKKLVIIGASSGGPSVVLKILQELPKDIEAGIIIVQHMDADFTKGYAEWLSNNSKFEVHEALEGNKLVDGRCYVAMGGCHLTVTPSKTIKCNGNLSNLPYVPSINLAFESVGKVFGKNSIGIVLSGMGDDGAEGLKFMRQVCGARTIAQDEKTSIIDSMPKMARDNGAAEFVLSPEKIPPAVLNILAEKC